jgi:hypothetical protein
MQRLDSSQVGTEPPVSRAKTWLEVCSPTLWGLGFAAEGRRAVAAGGSQCRDWPSASQVSRGGSGRSGWPNGRRKQQSCTLILPGC